MEKGFNNMGVEDLPEVVAALFEMGKDLPVWTFTGDLGAGKTTLIKALAAQLGIRDAVSSPTFNYVNDYDGKLYHFDCYRLKSVEEALNLGLEEYLDSGKRCWVEWPEVIRPILPEPRMDIIITHNQDATRNYSIIS
ncbi:tRNA (adenosine(37)-N6)-threonylcarbamoyltransferase complex ATPase subunit type 1 TsaE [Leadbetterella sp. DM7]|uniref:tRNA (adenosine(37)-N6)-threonylcarbamoyltransferase complex ATPase subunit type 1 TsaE n=1 Tax=Leadbetterella sp. DM7 TaxID=3235085 RepID=UPI00349ED555